MADNFFYVKGSDTGSLIRWMQLENDEISPVHDQFLSGFKFLSTQRFCKYICLVEVSIKFDYFDVPCFNMVFETVSFNWYMFNALFAVFAVSKYNIRDIAIEPFGCCQYWVYFLLHGWGI
jgi:hypothetical protein